MDIEKTVGINGSNWKSDVSKVCKLLNKNRHLLFPMVGMYTDLPEDGTYTDEVTDRILLFQRRVVTESATTDGRVDPGGPTLAKLIANARDLPISQSGPMLFPIKRRPDLSYKSHGRQFRANRNGGARKHAGCDLKFPPGVEIRAVADGTVIQPAYHFYSGTDALEVDHGSFIVRYGEIMPGSVPATINRAGAHIAVGDIIAKVGRLNSGNSMLHFEMYSGSKSGTLSGSNQFRRRSDLLDCTDYLDIAKLRVQDLKTLPVDGGGTTSDSGIQYIVNRNVVTRLRVRSAAATTGSVLGHLGRGTVVTFLEAKKGGKYTVKDVERDDWVKISRGALEGFVAGAFVEEVGTETKTEYYAVSRLVTTRLNVRETPDVSSRRLFSIGFGTVIKFLQELTGGSYLFEGQHRADWAEIIYRGEIGYVAAAYIEPVAAGASDDDAITEGNELNKILFELETAGASDATARQDRLPQQGIRGQDASKAMAKTDLGRINTLKHLFLQTGIKFGLPPALLGAIASRESRGGNALDSTGHGDGGHGFGIMQIDDRSWNADKSEGPKGLAHIDQAAAILAFKLETTEHTPGLEDAEALATAVSRYNGGRGLAFPRSDEGTTGADYMNDVWQRARFYASNIDWG